LRLAKALDNYPNQIARRWWITVMRLWSGGFKFKFKLAKLLAGYQTFGACADQAIVFD
jgi:hypothetical protein